MSETNNKDLPIVEEFLRYLLDERHFSPYTARCYGVDLRQYVEFLTDDFSLTVSRSQEQEVLDRRMSTAQEDAEGTSVVATLAPATVTGAMFGADINVLRSFLNRLSEQQYSAATMARKIATLRSFHRWMHKCGLIRSNPMTLIRTPRQNKRLPKAIDVEQVEKLLAAPDDSDLLGARDRSILETLYSTAIRCSELTALQVYDLQPERRILAVRTVVGRRCSSLGSSKSLARLLSR